LKVSIVIPALNEEKTIAICINKAKKALKDLNMTGEIVVADNGSMDKTVEISETLGARVVRVPDKGYGNALIGGFEAANGDFLIMRDADDSYNFEEIGIFIEKLKEGYDLVMGNRFKGKIEKGAMPFLHRYIGTPALTAMMNLFFKTGIGDTNCGMRALTKKAFKAMNLKAGGMEFATEMIIKASILNLRIAEVPCNLYRDKRDRKPHLNTWRDGWRHLRFMLLFASTWTYLIPGMSLSLIGISGMALLSLRDILKPDLAPFITQRHMLSFMLLLLSGFQILGLGLGAKVFSFSREFDSSSKSVNFLNRYFSLERGIVIGLLLIVISLLIFAYLLVSYYGRILPYLNDLIRLDIGIFAISFFILGIQCIYISFFISLFYIKVK